jgi:hypothetical protein
LEAIVPVGTLNFHRMMIRTFEFHKKQKSSFKEGKQDQKKKERGHRFFLHLTHRPEFLLESLHTCSFCHHDLLFFPLSLTPHPTSSLTLSEKDTLLTEPEEILDGPEEEMKTLKKNLLHKKSKNTIGSRKM